MSHTQTQKFKLKLRLDLHSNISEIWGRKEKEGGWEGGGGGGRELNITLHTTSVWPTHIPSKHIRQDPMHINKTNYKKGKTVFTFYSKI